MYIKTCKYCGKQFESTTPGKQICPGPHYQTCPVCNKQFVVELKDIYRSMCCSDECKKARRNNSIKVALSKLDDGWNQPKQIHVKYASYVGSNFRQMMFVKYTAQMIITDNVLVVGSNLSSLPTR